MTSKPELPDLKPMGLHAAIEAMKILAPYHEVVKTDARMLDVIRDMLRKMRARNPIDALRLLALMYHVDIDFVGEAFADKAGPHFVVTLAEGFEVNGLIDLLNAADHLGFIQPEASDGV